MSLYLSGPVKSHFVCALHPSVNTISIGQGLRHAWEDYFSSGCPDKTAPHRTSFPTQPDSEYSITHDPFLLIDRFKWILEKLPGWHPVDFVEAIGRIFSVGIPEIRVMPKLDAMGDGYLKRVLSALYGLFAIVFRSGPQAVPTINILPNAFAQHRYFGGIHNLNSIRFLNWAADWFPVAVRSFL